MLVSIACTAKFHSFYLAEQMYGHGVLKYLYTSYYGRFGRKRNNVGINLPQQCVRTNLLSAILNYGYNPGSILLRYSVFGNWVAHNLRNEDIVVTWGLSALPIIERARELGIVSVVERGSSHVIVQRNLLLEEYEKYSDSVKYRDNSFTPERMERELHEYEIADYISIPSEFVKRTFLEAGIPEAKLIKIPYGVDLSQFVQLSKQDNIFRVIYAGAMSLRKGVHYLLQAFAELRLPDAELWLLGGKQPEIEPFFEKYQDSFRHFGHVPQSTLHEYYSQCSVFAICSIEEGMAMVQAQAMVCGLPLICTTNTGGEDLIEEGISGYVLPIRDVEALKEKIVYLYEHRDQCYQMGQSAKQRIQNGFTWDDYGSRMIREYHRIVDR